MNAPALSSKAIAPAAVVPNEPQREGVKDTAESIVVAFILAFVFRAFIVEAFVIPTGSMAATLLGKHGTITCEYCGYEFDYGLTDMSPEGGRRMPQFRHDAAAVCPNCRHSNRDLKVNDEFDNAESGDRILVLKWPYELDTGRLGPQRWDVTVFKDPSDGTTNFIKRMGGLPHEVLMIVDGDVYTAPESALSPEAIKTFQYYRHIKEALEADNKSRSATPEERSRIDAMPPQERTLFERPMPESLLSELEKKLTIQRKTDEAQHSLWAIVYDHDYPPVQWDREQPSWRPIDGPSSRWAADPKLGLVADRQVRFDGVGQRRQGLAFAPGGSGMIEDYYAYNLNKDHAYPVSDLRLSFVLVPQEGSGAVLLRLTKRGQAFWARLARDGQVSLTQTDGREPDGLPTLATARVRPFEPGQKRRIAFENVDYRVRLYVDDAVVLETSPQQYAPDLHRIRSQPARPDEPPRIFAEDLKLELWHLALHRDVYYAPGSLDRWVRWATLGWGTDGNPMLLSDGEFFMLGDNSPQSKDSRLWDHIGKHLQERPGYQLGTVPRDQLIGRAFFVYWPSGLRIPWLPVLKDFGIIPNVGRMRWIR